MSTSNQSPNSPCYSRHESTNKVSATSTLSSSPIIDANPRHLSQGQARIVPVRSDVDTRPGFGDDQGQHRPVWPHDNSLYQCICSPLARHTAQLRAHQQTGIQSSQEMSGRHCPLSPVTSALPRCQCPVPSQNFVFGRNLEASINVHDNSVVPELLIHTVYSKFLSLERRNCLSLDCDVLLV